MQLPLVQVDAFADRLFAGNPAAVMILPRVLPDELLRAIAGENNLSETAFLVRDSTGWDLRWFTPTVEVDLCGHATLAAGAVVLRDEPQGQVTFRTRSGPLEVRREADQYALSLPTVEARPAPPQPALVEALGAAPIELWSVKAVHHATYWMAVYPHREDVAALTPDLGRLRRELRANVIATAPGEEAGVDFVSRFFAPGSGVDEDPVTGSAHATLAPYWRDRLRKNPLHALQISARGGAVGCRVDGDRVWLSGRCAFYLEGTVTIP